MLVQVCALVPVTTGTGTCAGTGIGADTVFFPICPNNTGLAQRLDPNAKLRYYIGGAPGAIALSRWVSETSHEPRARRTGSFGPDLYMYRKIYPLRVACAGAQGKNFPVRVLR